MKRRSIRTCMALLSGCLSLASCTPPSTRSDEESMRLVQEQLFLLVDISNREDFNFYCEGSHDPPLFFLYYPEIPGQSHESALAPAALSAFLKEHPDGRSLVTVYMEKTVHEWPSDLLDRIERIFQEAGFGQTIIIQGTGVAPSPILRGARNAWD